MSGQLKIYDVVMPNGVRTQMQLTEADAKQYGATPVERKPRLDPVTQHKMRTAGAAREPAKATRARRTHDKAMD